MKEIVIGSDKQPNFNSMTLWEWAPISENSIFYILENDLFENIILYVDKNSNEGEDLKKWLDIDTNRNKQSVYEKALELLIPWLSTEDLYEAFTVKSKKAHEYGYRRAQINICKALGIGR